jgi:DNA-binding NtrC family response regulator
MIMGSTEVISDAATSEPLENVEILVVDDDEDIRWLFSYILSKAGYRVESVCDSKGALEQIGAKAYDIVILDYILPEIKGSQLAVEILKKRSDVKIIFITGYPDFSDELMKTPSLEIHTVLYKPITGENLLKAIKTLQ